MYVVTAQCLNYSREGSKQQFAVYGSDTPVILRHGQGHQTWNELVDPKQYNNAKFEEFRLNSVCEKANVNFLLN